MPTVSDVLAALEHLAPSRYMLSGDKIGLQVGSRDREVSKLVVSLDRSLAAIRFAADAKAQMLISHHPLIFSPLTHVDESTHVGASIAELLRANIAFAAAHTNWDCAPGGINDALAQALGLTEVQAFGTGADDPELHLVTYCPEDSLQPIIDALSEAGAGIIGLYRRCAFYSSGTGTYYGGEGTNPVVGEAGQIEEAPEVRLEMVLAERIRDRAIEVLRKVHPYEEPAYHLHRLSSIPGQPIGRVGKLPRPMSLRELVSYTDTKLATRALAWGDADTQIGTLAVVGGAADDEWKAARASGADALLTGEVKQHHALEAQEEGFVLIAAGHFATENPGSAALAQALAQRLPEVEVVFYEPRAGHAGRPL